MASDFINPYRFMLYSPDDDTFLGPSSTGNIWIKESVNAYRYPDWINSSEGDVFLETCRKFRCVIVVTIDLFFEFT